MTTRRRLAIIAAVAISLLVAPTAAAGAAEPVVEIEWSNEAPLSGTVVDGGVIVDAPRGGVYPITVIDSPPLHGGDITMVVDVAVEEAGSPGYLELWVVLNDGSRYFSRTFDAAGVGLLQSGIIRTVEVPFALGGETPAALELNLVLPDGGRVEVAAVRLIELDEPAPPTDEWWSNATGGLIAALVGTTLGLLGALIGYLSSRGKARPFVETALRILTVLGVLSGVAGGIAIVLGQPFHVWFPLALAGVLSVAVFGGLLRTVPARYDEMELKKMRAYDLV